MSLLLLFPSTSGGGGGIDVYPTGVVASVLVGGTLVWGQIPDSQTPSWVPVNTTQTTTWTNVTDAQTPSWVEILK